MVGESLVNRVFFNRVEVGVLFVLLFELVEGNLQPLLSLIKLFFILVPLNLSVSYLITDQCKLHLQFESSRFFLILYLVEFLALGLELGLKLLAFESVLVAHLVDLFFEHLGFLGNLHFELSDFCLVYLYSLFQKAVIFL